MKRRAVTTANLSTNKKVSEGAMQEKAQPSSSSMMKKSATAEVIEVDEDSDFPPPIILKTVEEEIEEFRAGAQMSKTDLYHTWLNLQENIEEILNTHQAMVGFGQLYRWVYKLCFNRNGDILYDKTKEALQRHMKERLAPRMLTRFKAPSMRAKGGVLDAIVAEWEESKRGIFMVRDINLYLDRTYATVRGVPRVFDLGISLFVDMVILQPELVPLIEEALQQAYQQIMSDKKRSDKFRKTVQNFRAFADLCGDRVDWIVRPMIRMAVAEGKTEKMKDLAKITNAEEFEVGAWSIYLQEALMIIQSFENMAGIYLLPVSSSRFITALEWSILSAKSTWIGSMFRTSVRKRPKIPLDIQENSPMVKIFEITSGPGLHMTSFLSSIEVNAMAASCKALRMHHRTSHEDTGGGGGRDSSSTVQHLQHQHHHHHHHHHHGSSRRRNGSGGCCIAVASSSRSDPFASLGSSLATIRRVKAGIWGSQRYVNIPRSGFIFTCSSSSSRRWRCWSSHDSSSASSLSTTTCGGEIIEDFDACSSASSSSASASSASSSSYVPLGRRIVASSPPVRLYSPSASSTSSFSSGNSEAVFFTTTATTTTTTTTTATTTSSSGAASSALSSSSDSVGMIMARRKGEMRSKAVVIEERGGVERELI